MLMIVLSIMLVGLMRFDRQSVDVGPSVSWCLTDGQLMSDQQSYGIRTAV